MSVIGAIFAFLVGIPLSVWLLAQLGALLDEARRLRYLLRILSAACLIMLYLLIVDRTAWFPLTCAFVIATLCHTVGFAALIRFGTNLKNPTAKPK